VDSTLRLSGLKAWACSGLTLSGASLPRLEKRASRLSSPKSWRRRMGQVLTHSGTYNMSCHYLSNEVLNG
jgi:hypothetical protein